MFAEDSFFTLSGTGQAGLLLLSFILAAVSLWAARYFMRRRGVIARLGVAATLFALFVWLSPQVYYTYYRFLIDGLPAQWVIGPPPVWDIIKAATFSGPATLSAYGQGLLFVGLIILALARRDPRR